MDRRIVVVAASTAALAVASVNAAGGASKRVADTRADRDKALVEALVFHRSDIGGQWLSPIRERYPCTPPQRVDLTVTARRESGWIENGDTLIVRVARSVAETSNTPQILFQRRMNDVMRCFSATRAIKPATVVQRAPESLKVKWFYATASWRGNPSDLKIMVVRVGRAVVQYQYAWIKPPYHAEGLRLVRGAVSRGVAAAE